MKKTRFIVFGMLALMLTTLAHAQERPDINIIQERPVLDAEQVQEITTSMGKFADYEDAGVAVAFSSTAYPGDLSDYAKTIQSQTGLIGVHHGRGLAIVIDEASHRCVIVATASLRANITDDDIKSATENGIIPDMRAQDRVAAITESLAALEKHSITKYDLSLDSLGVTCVVGQEFTVDYLQGTTHQGFPSVTISDPTVAEIADVFHPELLRILPTKLGTTQITVNTPPVPHQNHLPDRNLAAYYGCTTNPRRYRDHTTGEGRSVSQ